MTKLAIGKLTIIVYLIVILWWVPSFVINFYGDDWFHLRITQITSFGEFLHFFSFSRGINDSPVYRPFSIEFYFFVMQKIFGLMPVFYHIFSLVIFGGILYFIQKLSSFFTKRKDIQLIIILLYGISVIHFMHFFYISMIQELLMTFFSLISICLFFSKGKTKYAISLLAFFCALLSKENAVVVPFLIFVLQILVFNKRKFLKLIPHFVILGIYVFVRFTFLEVVSSDSYIWIFSPVKVLNTFMWYGLWSLGTPELLVDYIGGGFKILPRFYSDLKILAYLIIFGTLTSTAMFVLILGRNFINKKCLKLYFGLLLFFVIGITPYLFLPWHKFSLNLTLPFVGLAVLFGLLFEHEKNKILKYAFVLIFIVFNLFSYFLAFKYSYAVGRSQISTSVQKYFNSNFAQFPIDRKVFFYNPQEEDKRILPYASEVSVALSRSNIFQTMYKNHSIEVYYESDNLKEQQIGNDLILINAKDFVP